MCVPVCACACACVCACVCVCVCVLCVCVVCMSVNQYVLSVGECGMCIHMLITSSIHISE